MAKTVIVKIPNVTEEVRIGYSFNEHSQSPNGYVFSQYLEREGVIDLCIADTGITVAGSFERAALYQEEIDGNE